MSKQNIRSEKERMEELKERKEQKHLKATRETIYKVLHEVWLNAEGLDERALEHKTYQLMNKLNEIGGKIMSKQNFEGKQFEFQKNIVFCCGCNYKNDCTHFGRTCILINQNKEFGGM